MKSEYLEYLNRKYGEELKKFGFVFDRIETLDYESGGRFSRAMYHIDKNLVDYEYGHLYIYVDNEKEKITDIELELRTPTKYYHITESKSMGNLLSILRDIKLEHDKERQRA